jgi:hypothetical protein
MERRKNIDELSNKELEEKMFEIFGEERLENYIIN